jgi:uncharacterized protein YdeI (YjbR/CyaY-like superfamily)
MKRSSAATETPTPAVRIPRVDAYIADAAPFARPILAHLRNVVHAACPEAVEEIKWRMPFFVYRGHNLCHMAGFKAHCAFGFWRAKEIAGLPSPEGDAAMGSLGRIATLDDLPGDDRLTAWIAAAIQLDATSTKPRTSGMPKDAIPMPSDVAGALAAHADAARHFAAFSPSCRREYLEWIIEAKKPETRAARIAKLVAQSAEGKSRHWKYQG